LGGGTIEEGDESEESLDSHVITESHLPDVKHNKSLNDSD
jgi:hypothetical protein